MPMPVSMYAPSPYSKTYLVASGFEDTWGRERNSSRSIVPELSCKFSVLDSYVRTGREGMLLSNLVELHEPFPQSVYFISVD